MLSDARKKFPFWKLADLSRYSLSSPGTMICQPDSSREVLGFGMLTADLQTMPHRRRKARLITAQTFGDAALHLIVDQMHRIAPFTNLCPYFTGRDILETTVYRFGSGGCPVKGLGIIMAKAR